MTIFPHDEFAKNYLEALLGTVGEVKTDRKVPSEIREIDVYFAPFAQPSEKTVELGLLGRFADTAALFEPFRNAVQPLEICSCMGKLFSTFAEAQRKSRREKTTLSMDDLPKLWIISPTASEDFLDAGLHATLDEENWGTGIYFFGNVSRTAIIVVHQLPSTHETLWLRILGRDGTQKQAIKELEALPTNNPLREKAVDLLLNLRTTLQLKEAPDEEENDLIMTLSPIYLEKLEEVRQEGRQETRRNVVESLLRNRFGSIDRQLNAVVEPLSVLAPDEFVFLLTQLSREDLINRFTQA